MGNEQPLILAVDTAGPCSTIGLTAGSLLDGRLLGEVSLNTSTTHSRRLLVGIERLLADSGLGLQDLDGLGVGLGPGSFTGLRIGLATMKGLAMAVDLPLLGVSTLDGLAARCTGAKRLCSLVDARKNEIYRAWYSMDKHEIYRRVGSIQALSPEALLLEVEDPCLMVGDGLLRYGEFLENGAGGKISSAPLSLNYPSGAATAFLCCEQLGKGLILDPESAVPIYVRASDAELNLKHHCA